MKTRIKRWGKRAAIHIPEKFLHKAELDIGQAEVLDPQEGKLMIETVTEVDNLHLPLRFTEAQLLADITPETAHADEVAQVYGPEVGEE